jgi:hypothetical protein
MSDGWLFHSSHLPEEMESVRHTEGNHSAPSRLLPFAAVHTFAAGAQLLVYNCTLACSPVCSALSSWPRCLSVPLDLAVHELATATAAHFTVAMRFDMLTRMQWPLLLAPLPAVACGSGCT